MIYIETNSTKPHVNLAFEEYFLESGAAGDEVLMLWKNEPTVVVGAYQNTIEEVDMAFAVENDIHIVRRKSGGGAVYHDFGNLCYSFILNQSNYPGLNFSRLLQPVVLAISEMDVPAQIHGRNDILIDGCKVSGSAARCYKDRILFHGTLLFEADLNMLGKVLVGKKAVSQSIKSVASKVTNINCYLDTDMSAFKKQLLGAFFGPGDVHTYVPSQSDLSAIHNLAKVYTSTEWTFGNDPNFGITYEKRFMEGTVSVHLDIERQTIKACKFRGDFLGGMNINDIENALCGTAYTEEAIIDVLARFDVKLYFGGIGYSDIAACILGL